MEMFIVSSGAVQVVGGPGDSIVFVTLGQVGCDWWRAGHVTTCSPLVGPGQGAVPGAGAAVPRDLDPRAAGRGEL